jgi:hypothetical protein
VRDGEDVAGVVMAEDTVLEAVERDLDGLPDDLRLGGLAAGARRIARDIDDPRTPAYVRVMAQRELREYLDRLRELAPEEKADDALDSLVGAPDLRLVDAA